MLDKLASDSLAQSIGWALVHSVWQDAALGALIFLSLAALRRNTANVRYIVACAGLVVMFVLPIATVVKNAPLSVSSLSKSGEIAQAVYDGAGRLQSALAAPAPEQRSRHNFEEWLPTAVVLWFAGVVILSFRILAGWWIVQRMRRQASPAATEITAKARALASRVRVTRAVQILESALVGVPTVIGSLRPVILWPATAMTGLPPEQLEAVIAHELAHIRRFDYFVNMLQTVVETLLFYHPAVWMISNRIRIEREHCCDDLAVGVCGDRLAYVSALANLERLRVDEAAFVLRATGGSLVGRVRRLLNKPSGDDRRVSAWVAIGVVACVLAVALMPMDSTAGSQPQAQPVQAQPPAVPTVPLAAREFERIAKDNNESQSSWSRFGQRYQVRYRGAIVVADDDTNIAQIAPGGYLIISYGSPLSESRTLELRGRADGTIERKYSAGSAERSYEPEGKAFLAEMLPIILHRSTFAAEQRIARILKQRGPVGALAEISNMQTDHTRHIHFRIFLQQARPAGSLLTQTLKQAAGEISSDFEMTELLIAAAKTLTLINSDWDDYFRAYDAVDSDYEHRRGLSALSDTDPSPEVLVRLLRSMNGINSSFEKASLLIHIGERRSLDGEVRTAYFNAADQISSDYERDRVFGALSTKERK